MAVNTAPSPRTNPVKVTMAPMSVRPSVIWRTSAPISKSSFWTRTAKASASGDGREECDLARPFDARAGLDVGTVDRRADDLAALEGRGVFPSARLQPADKAANRPNPRRPLATLPPPPH